jgi:hypothetical protein
MWNGRVLEHLYPQLFSFATDTRVTIKIVLQMDIFQLPLSEEAYDQFYDLQICFQSMQH